MSRKKHAGDLIKARRTKLGMTRFDVALAIYENNQRKLSPDAIGRYERGEHIPRADIARDLCTALGADFGDIFGGGLG